MYQPTGGKCGEYVLVQQPSPPAYFPQPNKSPTSSAPSDGRTVTNLELLIGGASLFVVGDGLVYMLGLSRRQN
jgi:hypothetical protein